MKENVERTFELFDEDNEGFIDFIKLKKVAIDLGEKIDDKTLNDMIFAADIDEDGKISKEEFIRVMRKMHLF